MGLMGGLKNTKPIFERQYLHGLRTDLTFTVLLQTRFVSIYLSPLASSTLKPHQDDQIHFAHPIIESTCKVFYFDKWAKVSMLDQDAFQGSVPKPLIALVGTIVSSDF